VAVYVEAEAPYRSNTQDLGQFYVRNSQGQKCGPFPRSQTSRPVTARNFTLRYKRVPVGGDHRQRAARGYSSEQATAALEDVFKQTMPHEMGFDYMGMSYQGRKPAKGFPHGHLWPSLLFVFLVLAALYESWSLPWSVLLSTPVACLGPSSALWLRRLRLGWFLPQYMFRWRDVTPRLV